MAYQSLEVWKNPKPATNWTRGPWFHKVHVTFSFLGEAHVPFGVLEHKKHPFGFLVNKRLLSSQHTHTHIRLASKATHLCWFSFDNRLASFDQTLPRPKDKPFVYTYIYIYICATPPPTPPMDPGFTACFRDGKSRISKFIFSKFPIVGPQSLMGARSPPQCPNMIRFPNRILLQLELDF